MIVKFFYLVFTLTFMSYPESEKKKTKKFTDEDISFVNRAQRRIYKYQKISHEEFYYNIDDIIDKEMENTYSVCPSDMSQFIYTLLYNSTKTNIFKKIYSSIHTTLFNNNIFSLEEKKKIQYIYEFIINKKTSFKINLNNITYMLFSKDYDYLKYYIVTILQRIKLFINEHNTIKTQYIPAKIDLLFDEKYIFLCVNSIVQSIISNIGYFHIVPDHIVDIIKNLMKINNNKQNYENEGIYIEQLLINDIKSKYDKVVIGNAKIIDNTGKAISELGKKGEFDIIIGTNDIHNDKLWIKSIYDIKRSARLIPNDVNLLNSIIHQPEEIYIENPLDKTIIKTSKFKNLIKGYIFIYDWNAKKESNHRLRDILVQYILKNSHNESFFKFMCSQIKIRYETSNNSDNSSSEETDSNTVSEIAKYSIQFNDSFLKKFRSVLDKDTKILQEKLKEYDIRKFVI